MDIPFELTNQTLAVLDDCVIMNDEFKAFATALDIKNTDIMRLMGSDKSTRVGAAMRLWMSKETRKMRHFIQFLADWEHAGAAAQLGFAKSFAIFTDRKLPISNNAPAFKNALYQGLNLSQRRFVLQAAGCTPEDADYIVKSNSPGQFFVKLSEQNFFTDKQVDLSIWTFSPALTEKIARFAMHNCIFIPNLGLTNEMLDQLIMTEMGKGVVTSSSSNMDTDQHRVPTSNTANHNKTTTMSVVSNPFVLAEQKSSENRPTTLHGIVHEKNAFYKDVCRELNNNRQYVAFLKNNNLATKEIGDWVAKVEEPWLSRRVGDPADTIFTHLVEVPAISGMEIGKFWEQLVKLNCAPLTAIVDQWKTFCQAKDESIKSSNVMSCDGSMTLRQTLLDLQICTVANVDEALGKLAREEFYTLDELKTLNEEELNKMIGWSLKMSKVCVAKLSGPVVVASSK